MKIIQNLILVFIPRMNCLGLDDYGFEAKICFAWTLVVDWGVPRGIC